MIAALSLLISGALADDEAPPDPTWAVSFETPIRPGGLPLGAGFGGGLRIGTRAGRLTPWCGGSASFARGGNKLGDEKDTRVFEGSLFTAQLGANVRVARLEMAETYLFAGGLMTYARGATEADLGRSTAIADIGRLGPAFGAVLGGGADARLTNRVSLGVEAGLTRMFGPVVLVRDFGAFATIDGSTSRNSEQAIFTLTRVRLSLWLGGAS